MLLGTMMRPLVSALVLAVVALGAHAQVATDHELAGHTTVFVRTQSLYPPYIDNEMSNRWWDFGGATVVNTNKYVRLTPDLQGRAGWLSAKMPFIADSWSIEFEYRIHGRSQSLFGDGLAFWYTKDKNEDTGVVYGHPNKWNGLMVAIDTYDNGRHGYTYPYIVGAMNDGTKTFSKDNDGKNLEIGGCEADVRDKHYATRVRVRYIASKYLRVEINSQGWDDWKTCFESKNVTLPSHGYIGFSAETGGLSDNHDLISVSTNQIIRDDNSHSNPVKPDTWSDTWSSTRSSSGPSFTLIFFVILTIAGVAYAVVQYVGNRPRRDYKHF